MRKYSKYKLNKARFALADRFGYYCQNSGRYIEDFSSWNFPHFWSKNKMTEDEIYTQFTFVCRNLHVYEHTLARNLEADYCVSRFLDKYKSKKKFWKKWIKDHA